MVKKISETEPVKDTALTAEEIAAELDQEVKDQVVKEWLGGIHPRWIRAAHNRLIVDSVGMENEERRMFLHFGSPGHPFRPKFLKLK